MNDILQEITHQLPFLSKIVVKLCNRKMMNMVKIIKLPRPTYRMLNDSRLDLFPDLIEMIYKLYEDKENNLILRYPFHYSKLLKFKLVYLEFDGMSFFNKFKQRANIIDFNILPMIKTLKKLEMTSGIDSKMNTELGLQICKYFSSDYIATDLNPIFRKMDLKGLRIDLTNNHGAYKKIDFSYESLDHMKLFYMNSSVITDYRPFHDTMKYMELDLRYGIDNIPDCHDKISELMTFTNLRHLRIGLNPINLDDFCYSSFTLKHMKLHSLSIEFFDYFDIDVLDKFISGLKLHYLKVSYCGDQDDWTNHKIPVKFILQNCNTSILALEYFVKYNDDELKLIKDRGITVMMANYNSIYQ